MKKITLILACVTLACTSYAQTVSGSKALGGGISYTSTSDTDFYEGSVTQSQLAFSPSFGYFVSDNIMVGGSVGLGVSKISETDFTPERKTTTFSLGPFARYYIHTSNESFAFFGQFAVLFGSGKTTQDPDLEVKSSYFDLAVSPGFAYFFNEHWALEIGFRGIGFNKYDPDKDADDDEIKTTTIGLNSLSPSNFAIRYHF